MSDGGMTVVETASGKVEGRIESGLHVFRGIPYAAPPVGDRRLAAPVAPDPWTGVRPAHEFGFWAPQPKPASSVSGVAPGAQDEDCLTLNVWSPGTDDAGRPVMVWIHGGGFISGSAAAPLYGGAPLTARGDIVFVSLNYRLGILGFAAHRDLADDNADGAAGNWGLLDQIAALRWVRDNIAAFGGDPDNVTVFGESAGGMSVADLLVMPSARGLLRRAIVQSGPPNAVDVERAETVTAKLMAELGVTTATALREVPVDRLLAAQEALVAERRAAGLPLVPVVDGASIPVSPLRALSDGAAAGVDLLIGTNRDEAKMWMVADPANRDPDEGVLHRRIDAIFRANDVDLSPDEAIDAYRSARSSRGEDASPRELWSAIQTDHMFRIGSVRAAETQAPHAPTYMYLFTATSPAMGGALGSCHALEIPFALGTHTTPGMDRFAGAGPEVERLSAEMMDAWLAFARTGNPAHDGIPAWPAYDAKQRATMVFGLQTHLENAPYEDERRFWAAAASH